jgi:predicted amino acid racemase
MQTKLTLRVEEALVRKAKQLAKKRGTSVSRIFGEFISTQSDELPSDELPPITSSMIGIIRKSGTDIDENDYSKHLEDKYL